MVARDKIYFDGFLPPSKTETRLSRLTSYTTRLSQYHTKYKLPCTSRMEVPRSSQLFGNTAARSRLGTLPPLPFLVPAIIEALADSSYADVVEVVPGEADPFCARFAKEHGSIVLTGDSDLLVHDVGDKGSVAFFKDFLQDDETSEVSSLIYQQAVIAERLGLPSPNGLQYLAFEMHMEGHGSFKQLVAQAKLKRSSLDHPTAFAEFIREYESIKSNPKTDDSGMTETLQILRKLDPRISEYVLQFTSLARITRYSPFEQTPKDIHVFLPFIVDCPVRTNSWEISTPSRQLAYGLINLIVPDPDQRSSVFEHRRLESRRDQSQSKSKGLEVLLPAISNIPSECTSFLNTIGAIAEKLPSHSSPDYWLAVAVFQELEWAHLHAKPSLTEIVIQEVKGDKKNENQYLSWNMVHFLGHIQASLYSMRTLGQITRLVIVYANRDVPAEILALHQKLGSLPKLSAMPSYGDFLSLIDKIHELAMVKSCKELLLQDSIKEAQVAASAGAEAKTEGKKSKRKRTKSGTKEKTERKKSSNPFALLEGDW